MTSPLPGSAAGPPPAVSTSEPHQAPAVASAAVTAANEDRPAERATPHAFALLRLAPLRRLIGIRISSSLGDGAFQGALVSAVFFNPTRQSSAAAIAAAFAVLLLPYSVIGPFAGALLDRWYRRSVIIVATLVRAILVLSVALALALNAASWVLLAGALLVTGAARFVGSGMSAALPHTVPRNALVPANAIAVTCGSIATAVGGGYAIVLRDLVGVTNGPLSVVTATVPVFYLAAVLLTAGFPRRALGPDSTDEPSQPIRAVLAGFTSAVRHAVARPTVGVSVVLVVTVRFCFGMATLVILLLYQHHFTARVGLLVTGINGIGEVLAIISVGLLVGAVATPVLVRLFGRTHTVVSLMAVAAVTVVICGPRFSMVAIFVAAPVLAFTYQAVKVCVDAIVQSDADDAYVGRVFALYDTANNVFYVGAFAVGAMVVPFDGRSVTLIVVMAAVYLAAGIAYVAIMRTLRERRLRSAIPHATA